MEDIGQVIRVEDKSIIIMKGSQKFNIPKNSAEAYDGSEVYLKISVHELGAYEMKGS